MHFGCRLIVQIHCVPARITIGGTLREQGGFCLPLMHCMTRGVTLSPQTRRYSMEESPWLICLRFPETIGVAVPAKAELKVMLTFGRMSKICQNKTNPVLSQTWDTIFHRMLLQSPGTTTTRNLLYQRTPHPSSIQQFMPYQNSYEVGGSSQGGTQDLIDSMDRVRWTNFSLLFDGLDHFIPQQSSPHTPIDLALTLPRSDTYTQPAVAGRRSASIGDTASSALRPYDAMQMPGRRLSYTEADATADEVEGPAGRPRRDTQAPLCGTGGRLGHHHH
ncbi:uncharacterized protein DS421_11g322560 [Arachis hypogaea]|nr:uncharacterized protein DS421_11g322560 [Arachis hypogaea]